MTRYKAEIITDKHTEKRLGKINSVTFGFIGCQDAQFGLSVDLISDCIGCGDTVVGGWAYGIIDPDKYSRWTDVDRTKSMAEMCKTLCEMLKDAGVDDISKLNGKPVEFTSASNTLMSWRILTEVL